jgi:hypothetical protein
LTSSVVAGVAVTGATGSTALVSAASVVGAAAGSVATGAGSAAGAVSVAVAPFVVVSAALASTGFSSVFFDFLEEKIFLILALSYCLCQYVANMCKFSSLEN